jgi:hypothetical protein
MLYAGTLTGAAACTAHVRWWVPWILVILVKEGARAVLAGVLSESRVVRTALELQAAALDGVPYILITDHLDLTKLAHPLIVKGRNQVLQKVTALGKLPVYHGTQVIWVRIVGRCARPQCRCTHCGFRSDPVM